MSRAQATQKCLHCDKAIASKWLFCSDCRWSLPVELREALKARRRVDKEAAIVAAEKWLRENKAETA